VAEATKAQEFDFLDANILNSFDAKVLATILTNEGSNCMMHEYDGFNKGTKNPGLTLAAHIQGQPEWMEALEQ